MTRQRMSALIAFFLPLGPIPLSAALVLMCLWPQGQALAGDVFKGKEIYRSHCEVCHGPTGRSALPSAPSFAGGQGLMQPDRSLYETIRSGKNAMPGYEGVLSDREIFDVISYIRTLL